VLYLPGTNFNAATSLALASELARSVRVVLADLPGQPGLSTGRRPSGDRVGAYGEWAGDVLDWVQKSVPAGPLVFVGHSLGAAVALAAPTRTVAALVVIDPAGLVRLRVPSAVLRATMPWLLRPTEPRSRALLRHLTAPGRSPDPALVEWMTLVARHTKPSGAPGPLPSAVTVRWRTVCRRAVSGEYDCFLPPHRVGPAVRDRLDMELTTLPRLGHLSVDDDPAGLAAVITTALIRDGESAFGVVGSWDSVGGVRQGASPCW
jgi:pimeloyl-ACP methyl ester carboxylesterase